MSWPVSPSNGQQVLINGILYVYDSVNAVWNRVYATTSVGGGIVTAVTVTQASQPNITSVGTMSNLTATGNIQGGNLIGVHANGNSNVSIAGNANVTISVAGNASILTVTGTGVNVAGTLNTGTGNANVGNLGTTTAIITTGNITTLNSGLIQNGNSNITITSNSNISHYVTGNLTSQLTVTATGANIPGYANIAGDTTVGANLIVGGNLFVNGTTTTVNSTTSRIVDPIVEQGGGANGAALATNDTKDRGLLLHYYTTAPVDAFMGWDNSNAEFAFASNASLTSEVATFNTFGNIRVGNAVLGNLATANYFTGTLTTAAQPNITSVGTLVNTTLGAANSFTGGNLVSANHFTGTLTTAVQPNITSVGTLTSLTAGLITATSGGIKVGNIQDPSGTNTISLASGAVTMLGNLTIGTGGTGNLTTTNANLGNLATANYVTGTLTTAVQPNITSVGTLTSLSVTGNISSGNATLGNVVTANYFTSNTSITANAISVSGLLTSGETTEVVIASGALSSTTTNYNMTTGATFYHSSVSSGANWTANFQNVPTTDGRSMVATLIVVQGATPYIPSAVQIDGSAQTIKWTSGAAPTGTISGVDIFSFALIRSGAAWAQILGSYSSYS
jgi:hypothetical protein